MFSWEWSKSGWKLYNKKNEESTKVSIYTIDATRTNNKIVLYYGSAAGKLRNLRFIYAFGEI